VIEYVRQEEIRSNKDNIKTLYIFGTYGIGKERLFMAVAEDQNKKVEQNTFI
jgi:DNA replication protein DnaC